MRTPYEHLFQPLSFCGKEELGVAGKRANSLSEGVPELSTERTSAFLVLRFELTQTATMSAPALKKRKKTPKPTPTPPNQSQPHPIPMAAPLSAIAARKAAAALLLSAPSSSSSHSRPTADDYDGDHDQEALDIINSPVPSSPSGSSSSGFSSSSLLKPEPLTMMMDGELVSLGSSRPTAPNKQQRKRKGKGKEAFAPPRYWDEDLPEMETQGRGRVEFIGGGRGGQRGWSPSGGMVGGGFDREMGDESEEEEVGLDEEVGSEVEGAQEDQEEEEEEEGVLTPGRAGKRKREKLASASIASAGGAMSNFLPSFGKNVLRVEEEQLRKVFMDVEEGEGAVVVSLKEGEVSLTFSFLPFLLSSLERVSCLVETNNLHRFRLLSEPHLLRSLSSLPHHFFPVHLQRNSSPVLLLLLLVQPTSDSPPRLRAHLLPSPCHYSLFLLLRLLVGTLTAPGSSRMRLRGGRDLRR